MAPKRRLLKKVKKLSFFSKKKGGKGDKKYENFEQIFQNSKVFKNHI